MMWQFALRDILWLCHKLMQEGNKNSDNLLLIILLCLNTFVHMAYK